jgi:pimeloyl-ACP methyl ester carboxylesterase
MLIIQGRDDQYGTAAQIMLARQEAYCPVETVLLERCGHSPQFDRRAATLEAIATFSHRVLTLHEGFAPAA